MFIPNLIQIDAPKFVALDFRGRTDGHAQFRFPKLVIKADTATPARLHNGSM
jgi:hypothetical protein